MRIEYESGNYRRTVRGKKDEHGDEIGVTRMIDDTGSSDYSYWVDGVWSRAANHRPSLLVPANSHDFMATFNLSGTEDTCVIEDHSGQRGAELHEWNQAEVWADMPSSVRKANKGSRVMQLRGDIRTSGGIDPSWKALLPAAATFSAFVTCEMTDLPLGPLDERLRSKTFATRRDVLAMMGILATVPSLALPLVTPYGHDMFGDNLANAAIDGMFRNTPGFLLSPRDDEVNLRASIALKKIKAQEAGSRFGFGEDEAAVIIHESSESLYVDDVNDGASAADAIIEFAEAQEALSDHVYEQGSEESHEAIADMLAPTSLIEVLDPERGLFGSRRSERRLGATRLVEHYRSPTIIHILNKWSPHDLLNAPELPAECYLGNLGIRG
ncbi:MAG: hypothetical protein AAF413_02880 [Patescibacteria group bacterium]